MLAQYFELLQAHASAEEMRETILTADFETGFEDGVRWNVDEFLAARAGFVDERHEVREVSNIIRASANEMRFETRLTFSLRDPGSGDELTGIAHHRWLLRRSASGEWRVAAQIVKRFEDLNERAAQLFATPDEGLNWRERRL